MSRGRRRLGGGREVAVEMRRRRQKEEEVEPRGCWRQGATERPCILPSSWRSVSSAAGDQLGREGDVESSRSRGWRATLT
eukprot:392396-Hanusia_phi.AAC.1